MSLAIRVIPCLDVDNGRVVKGVNFRELRDAGDPVELAALYDAQGADELTFLDISASHEGRATTLEVVSRTAEQVFIPLTVGGGDLQHRRRRHAAPRRCRQGRGQHRGHPPARAGRRDRRPVRQPGAGALGRRPPCAGDRLGLRGDHPRRPQVRRPRRDRLGQAGVRARRRRDPAQRHGRRRHPRRLRPRPDPGRTTRGHRPRDRERWRGGGRALPAGRRRRRGRGAGRQRLPLRHAWPSRT